jgi:hypothetical protein
MYKNGSPGNNDYVVGRGRPPLLTRWKPGQSGNPKGRPKGVKNMLTYFRQELNRKIHIKESGIVHEVTLREAIAKTATNLALKGDHKFIPVMMAVDREVSALEEREKLSTWTRATTPEEAMNLFRQQLDAGRPKRRR